MKFFQIRKVFSIFSKKNIVNTKIIIPIVIGIIITIGAITISFEKSNVIEVEDVLDKEFLPNEEITPEIQAKLDDIEKKSLENEYTPLDREWITSGPFQIDRSKYVLGEKVFLRIGELSFEEKGQVVFLRPLNNTHYSVYISIPFDGAQKSAFNYYIEPDLSAINGICSVEDLIGDWRVMFRGTNYDNLEFKVLEDILPGDEKYYKPVC